MGVDADVAQLLVRPLILDEIETRGVRRGMKYYRKGDAPPEEPEEPEPDEIR